MSNEITAIETEYDGHLFRSRLEARWAVFFNSLGIRYEYEIEGFNLGGDGFYLPDFWLPEQQCWIEIKGKVPSIVECHVCTRLSETGVPVYVIWGNVGDHRVYGWWQEKGTWDSPGCGYCAWRVCRNCDAITLAPEPECCELPDPVESLRVRDACILARRARFEYDERGKLPRARFKP